MVACTDVPLGLVLSWFRPSLSPLGKCHGSSHVPLKVKRASICWCRRRPEISHINKIRIGSILCRRILCWFWKGPPFLSPPPLPPSAWSLKLYIFSPVTRSLILFHDETFRFLKVLNVAWQIERLLTRLFSGEASKSRSSIGSILKNKYRLDEVIKYYTVISQYSRKWRKPTCIIYHISNSMHIKHIQHIQHTQYVQQVYAKCLKFQDFCRCRCCLLLSDSV